MISSKLSSFEIGPIRPPSEGSDHSLLIRVTRNCPWNKCAFCRTYRGKKFEYRSVEDVKLDIDAAKAINEELKAESWRMGLAGQMTNELVRAVVQNYPAIFNPQTVGTEVVNARVNSFVNVANWTASGSRTVFLQDANTLIVRTPDLLEILEYLKNAFPSIERVTSYARSHTAARKSSEELQELHQAGLSRLHIGMESGCDEILAYIQKGVTGADHIVAGQKIVESGISLSEYVIPGLGGGQWSSKHAKETASVLNQIDPDFIRFRSLVVKQKTELHKKVLSNDFEPVGEDETVDEIRSLIDNLNCHSYLASDHIANLIGEIEGQLPQAKNQLLKIIDDYRLMPLEKRLEMQLKRRMNSHLAIHGRIAKELEQKVQNAFESIGNRSSEMEAVVSNALDGLKQGAM